VEIVRDVFLQVKHEDGVLCTSLENKDLEDVIQHLTEAKYSNNRVENAILDLVKIKQVIYKTKKEVRWHLNLTSEVVTLLSETTTLE